MISKNSVTKVCSHCHVEKPVSEFHKNRSTKDGYQNLCKDCHRQSWFDWSKRHPDVVKEQTRRSAVKRREYVLRRKAEYQEYMALYHLAHKTEWKAYRQARRSRIRGNGGSFTGKQWRELCEKYGNVCLRCGEDTQLVPDHIIPISLGGDSFITNIQPLCQPCNRWKHTQVIDFR